MIIPQSNFRMTMGAALLAGATVLAGCVPAPVTTTTTSRQTTTTPPPPMVSTTTTSSTDEAQPVAHVARVPHKHARYAIHHRAAGSETGETTTTTDITVAPMAAGSTTVKSTETTTRTH